MQPEKPKDMALASGEAFLLHPGLAEGEPEQVC